MIAPASELRARVNYYNGIIAGIRTGLSEAEELAASLETEIDNMQKCRELLLAVASIAQQTVKQKIETIVTSALQSIYQRPFEFKLKFSQQRNRSVAAPVIVENGEEYDAAGDLGGGVVDVVSLALRIGLWSMMDSRSRNIFILDEPFKFLGQGAIMDRAAAFIKEVIASLGVQFLIVTHDQQLAEVADKVWDITQTRGVSKVEERRHGRETVVREFP